jgi:hypothetical protein
MDLPELDFEVASWGLRPRVSTTEPTRFFPSRVLWTERQVTAGPCTPSEGVLVHFEEVDSCQRTVLNPLVELGSRPLAFVATSLVELVDEGGEQPASFCLIGNHGGDRRQIRQEAMLEVKREMRLCA